MPPSLTRIPVRWRRASLILVVACLGTVGLCQSGRDPGTEIADFKPAFHFHEMEPFFPVRFDLARSDIAHPDIAMPDPASLPDEPLPRLFANGETSLDLTPPAMEIPLHQPADDMWGQQNPPPRQQAQAATTERPPTH